jgi:hypothetical protein
MPAWNWPGQAEGPRLSSVAARFPNPAVQASSQQACTRLRVIGDGTGPPALAPNRDTCASDRGILERHRALRLTRAKNTEHASISTPRATTRVGPLGETPDRVARSRVGEKRPEDLDAAGV